MPALLSTNSLYVYIASFLLYDKAHFIPLCHFSKSNAFLFIYSLCVCVCIYICVSLHVSMCIVCVRMCVFVRVCVRCACQWSNELLMLLVISCHKFPVASDYLLSWTVTTCVELLDSCMASHFWWLYNTTIYYNYTLILKNFAWVDQRAKVCFIFHNVQLRCEECFIKWQQCFMKLQI